MFFLETENKNSTFQFTWRTNQKIQSLSKVHCSILAIIFTQQQSLKFRPAQTSKFLITQHLIKSYNSNARKDMNRCIVQSNWQKLILGKSWLLNFTIRSMIYSTFDLYDMKYIIYHLFSFVKGWGSSYQRQRVTQCPCWIQIRINDCLQKVDLMLKNLEPPHEAHSNT